MMFLLKWLLLILAIMISGQFLPGVKIDGFWTAFWLSIFLSLINLTLKPLLVILTLPINILTLGLFIFVINALMIMLASSVIKGFVVQGFWSAMLFSVSLSVISYFINSFLKS